MGKMGRVGVVSLADVPFLEDGDVAETRSCRPRDLFPASPALLGDRGESGDCLLRGDTSLTFCARGDTGSRSEIFIDACCRNERALGDRVCCDRGLSTPVDAEVEPTASECFTDEGDFGSLSDLMLKAS